jgi:serine phosphatase RsbU (regulator of sigma subunit)
MKFYFTLLSFTALLFSTAVSAAPFVVVDNWNTPAVFTGEKKVLLMKGDSPEYKDAEFDDRNWQVTALPSKWQQFYPDWNGICWYRIHIKVPESLPGKSPGVSLGVIIDSDETYFNGVLIGRSGTVPLVRTASYDKKRIYEIPVSLIRPGEDNVIAVRASGVFPTVNGPWEGQFLIGEFSSMQRDLLMSNMFELIFVVIYFTVGIYFLLFFIRRPVQKEYLLFSLFSISIGAYFFFGTQIKHFLGLDFYSIKKTEYIQLCVMPWLFFEFISFFYNVHYRSFRYIIGAISITCLALVSYSENPDFWWQISMYPVNIMMAVTLCSTVYIIIANVKKNVDARYMLAAFIILAMAILNDMLVNMLVFDMYKLSQYGYLAFICGIAVILDNSFARLHARVEDLNRNLENKVEERTMELKQANDELLRTRDALWGEMELAKKIQTVLLPDRPDMEGYEISAYMKPADEVGGDYYDVISIGGYDWIVIGDVSGHGVSAGLIMMMVQTAINVTVNHNPDMPPSKLLSVINKTITQNARQLNEDKYMTITVLAAHTNGRFVFSGLHQDIMIYRKKTGRVELVETQGIWIGIMDEIEGINTDETFQMEIGDVVLLYTDGITEAWKKGSVANQRDPEQDMFGERRVVSLFESIGDASPEKTVHCLIDALEDYECRDDVTLLALKRIS